MKKKKLVIPIILTILLVTLIVIATIYFLDKKNRSDLHSIANIIIEEAEKTFSVDKTYINLSKNNFGQDIESGILQYNNSGKVIFLKIKRKNYCYTKINNKVSINNQEECLIEEPKVILTEHSCLESTCEAGTKLEIQVYENKSYDFYVIEDKDEYLTLLMREPIYYKTAFSDEESIYNALLKLSDLTTNWEYIPSILEYSYDNSGNLYSNLTIKNGVTTIDENIVTENTKARLITKEELEKLGCNLKINSCPKWVYDNLSLENTNLNPYGFWTLTTSRTVENYIYTVFYTGNISTNVNINQSSYGLKPVIIIKKN